MKNSFALLIGLLVVLVLLVNMFCFQVRHDEVAVVTTFGKADENSVRAEPGLYFRFPQPIQKVTKYPKRLHLLETKTEEQALADSNNIAAAVYVAWQVSDDPLTFYTQLGTTDNARNQIESRARNIAQQVIAKRPLSALVNTDEQEVELDEISTEIRTALAAELEPFGVEVKQVGLRRNMLPESVTPSVFKRMIDDRDVLAEATRSRGTSTAQGITAEAEAIRKALIDHADRYASLERSKGDEAAAELYSVFSKDQEFAAFLKRMEAIPRMIGPGATLILGEEILQMQRPASSVPVPVYTTEPTAEKE